MGLIRAIKNAVGGVLADQWREYFICDSLDSDILMTRGYKRVSQKRGGGNSKGEDNIISNGSIVAVNEGQCMIIVEQGEVVEFCAEAGEFVYDSSTEPSLFYGDLGETIRATFDEIGRRFSFGGSPGRDQRVYYFNTKEIMGNKYGTANPVPFRVVDEKIGLDIDTSIRCNGEYSYRISDPLLFYTNVCGNVSYDFTRDEIDSQLKTELMTALQPAFARISAMGIRYSELPAHTMEVADALNEVLSAKWSKTRGMTIVSFGINSVKAPEADENLIKDMQRTAMLRNPGMAAATLAGAQAQAMQAAASNKSAGSMMAFANMNLAQKQGGVNTAMLYNMDQKNRSASADIAPSQPDNPASPIPAETSRQSNGRETWNCGCGAVGNAGKFCSECGAPKPAPDGWICSCGNVNKGRFCSECGLPRPMGALRFRCGKCGWEPEDPEHPPKFCPECGDPFDNNDLEKE